jgi:hypothetical protein
MKTKKILVIAVILLLIIGTGLAVFFILNKKTEVFNPNQYNNIKSSSGFDPSGLKWSEINPIGNYWSGRDSHMVVIFKDKIWVSGGVEGGKITPPPVYEKIDHASDLWSSSDLANWNLVTDKAPWGARRTMVAVEFKGKLWAMAGWAKQYGDTKNDIWVSDDGENWKLAVGSAPWAPREGSTLLVYKDKIWIAGGVDFYNGQKRYNDVWSSDDGINWVEVTANAAWSPRYDHAMVVYKDKLWLTGGMTNGYNIYKEVWVSEDGANWTLVTDNPPWPARHGHLAFDYKGLMWIVGGWCEEENRGLNDTWYTEDGEHWQALKTKALWPGREDVAGIIWNDKIVIMGGMADEGKYWEWKNDIWELSN